MIRPDLNQLEKKLYYTFKDIELLEQALTHKSVGTQNNERLEYLGDSILGSVIAIYLYQYFVKASEGELTRLRAQLVCEESLAELAKSIQLGDFLNLGSGELKSGGFRRDSILSDALEAILGAIYLETNFEKVQQIILKLYQDKLAHVSLDNAGKDSKTCLQEWLQHRKRTLPVYTIEEEKGKDHEKSYRVSCFVESENLTTEGIGSSRRKAEQVAAKHMMEMIHE